jgi:hypothetical protein
MERDGEVALAQSAAPPSISSDAEVMVLGKSRYETGLRGKNDFVSVAPRSWTAGTDDPDFGIQSCVPDLFQRASRAVLSAADDQEDRVDLGGAFQKANGRCHQQGNREKGIACIATQRHVLQDVQARLPE